MTALSFILLADKLFVVLCLGNYIEVDKDYNVVASSSEKMEEKWYAKSGSSFWLTCSCSVLFCSEVLRGQFSQMDFDVINLTLEVSSSSGNGNGGSPEKSGEDGNGEHRLQVQLPCPHLSSGSDDSCAGSAVYRGGNDSPIYSEHEVHSILA